MKESKAGRSRKGIDEVRAFQTRLVQVEEENGVLDECVAVFSKVERTLFADLQKNRESLTELKAKYLVKYGITARQFNSCHSTVKGKTSSLKEIQKQRIVDLQDKEKRLKKKLASKRCKGCHHRLHQSLQRTQGKLARALSDRKLGRVRLCFGSRKLFQAQHHLKENAFNSHEEWKRQWQEKRNSGFFLIGSKDETAGNQSCKAEVQEDGSLTLRVRLPDCLNRGEYLTLKDVRFSYGQKEIIKAIEENAPGRPGCAISYRFLRDEKGWRVFASIEEPPEESVTKPALGYIGVDINIDHLATAETDRNGNAIQVNRYCLNLYGKTREQAAALIGDVAKKLVDEALSKKKPIVIEKLDFVGKKRELKKMSLKQARMLSSFAYQRVLTGIKARAKRNGVQVFEVNPAYTSLIGKIKFAKRYGLTIHQAAALCIARRQAGFSETLPFISEIPDGKGGHVAFAVPVRKQQRFSWQHLGEVSKKLQTALAEHFRVARSQSVEGLSPT